jgi:hypothetical protein
LRLPRAAFSALHARKLVHRSIADLALHGFPIVHHGKTKGQPFAIMADDFVARKRHPIVPFAPRTGQC